MQKNEKCGAEKIALLLNIFLDNKGDKLALLR
jgi:hypothetical protein